MLGVFGEEEKGKKKWRSTGRGREEKMGLAVGSPPLFNGRLWPKNKNQSGGRGRKTWGGNLGNWGGQNGEKTKNGRKVPKLFNGRLRAKREK